MKKTFFIFCILITLSAGNTLYAQSPSERAESATQYGYQPIVGIPGVDSNALSTEGYVTALYKLAITVACLLALYKIIFGGVKWALSDVITTKGEAIKDIKGALLGLLIVLSAVLILNTINPNLTQLNIFGEGAPSIDAIENEEYNEDIPFGTTVSTRDSEGLAALTRNCTGVDGVIATQVEDGGLGGFNGWIGCYDRPSNINANIGDTFDASLYPPGTDESRFEQTCEDEETGGRYETNGLYSSTCEQTAVSIGNRLDMTTLENLSIAERTNAMFEFQSECPGEVIEQTDANDTVTFLVCE